MVNLLTFEGRFEDQLHVGSEVITQGLDRRPVTFYMFMNRHVATQVRKLGQTPELADLSRHLVKRFEKSDEARSRYLRRPMAAIDAVHQDMLATGNVLSRQCEASPVQ